MIHGIQGTANGRGQRVHGTECAVNNSPVPNARLCQYQSFSFFRKQKEIDKSPYIFQIGRVSERLYLILYIEGYFLYSDALPEASGYQHPGSAKKQSKLFMEIFFIFYCILGGIGFRQSYGAYKENRRNLFTIALLSIPLLFACLYITVFYLEGYVFGFGPAMFGVERLKIYVITPSIVFLPLILSAEMILISQFTFVNSFTNFKTKELFYIFLCVSSIISIFFIFYWEVFVDGKTH